MKCSFYKLMINEIKTTHAVVVALISLILTGLSTFQVSLLGSIPVVVACGGLLIAVAVVMFFYSALNSLIVDVNNQENIKTTAGALPKATNIVFEDDEECVKIILSDEQNILVQVNTLVSVFYSEVDERLIAVGHILKLQSGNEKKIEVCARPLEKSRRIWEQIKEKQGEHIGKIIVSCCIDKSSVPKGYLEEETRGVSMLIQAATQKEVREEDGVQL
ncbi:MAG: hypothetical protein ACRCXB_09175 [Aeromonadaceae bacterium]